MQIRLGYELVYDFPQPTPMMLMLNVHYTRVSDLVVPDHLATSPGDPDPWLPRRLWQLVQSDRGADRTNPSIGQRHRQRHGRARCGRQRGPAARSRGSPPKRPWCFSWAAGIARPTG